MKQKGILLALVLSVFSFTAFAQQSLRSAYFLEGYTYKYKFNPAFKGVRNHVAIPAIGSLSAEVQSNLGLSTLFYPTDDGKLVLFTDSGAISMEDFDKKILDLNSLNAGINSSLISVGFWTKKSFHTVDLSVRVDAVADVPGDLFRFLKELQGTGGVQNSFDIQKLAVKANAYAELSYGYARDITSWIHVGGRLKFLYGLAQGQANFSKFSVDANTAENKYKIDAQGYLELSQVSELSLNADKELEFGQFNAKALANPDIGFAADLGVSVDFAKYFTASLSVLDIGFMNWKNIQSTQTLGIPWEYTPETSGEEAEEGLKNLVKFEDITTKSKTSTLATTLNVGLDARMPFYEPLSFSILSTTRINGPQTWTEGRFYANIAPTRWLGFSVNYGISNFGSTLGSALSIHAQGFNLFLGSDSILTFTEFLPGGLPAKKLNTNVAVGLNILFGKYHGREFAKKK